jgi:predicted deacylase
MKDQLTIRRSMTRAGLEIGTARGESGAYAYGTFDAMTLPSGGTETFPVIIGQGRQDGPVLWLTASIHGDEYTGIQVIHQLLNADLLKCLRGAIVAIPTLNPAGLRAGERVPYYMRKQDPNRLFPALLHTEEVGEIMPPLEQAYRRLFELIQKNADYLIDLHNFSLGSIPFAFRDPVYYQNERGRFDAQRLWLRTSAMLSAFGHTIINEFASAVYLKKNLHRSVSGAALHVAAIPAFTAELGGYLTIDPAVVKAATIGLRNVMRWAGMLDDPPEMLQGIPVFSPGYPVRRIQHAYVPQTGIVRLLIKAGAILKAGDAVAQLTDIYGRPLGRDNGYIYTEYDGMVMGTSQGAVFYQGDPLMSLAIRDDSEMVLPAYSASRVD